jgi:hypothetical protein
LKGVGNGERRRGLVGKEKEGTLMLIPIGDLVIPLLFDHGPAVHL